MEEKILDFERDWEDLKKEMLPELTSEEAEEVLCGMLALVISN